MRVGRRQQVVIRRKGHAYASRAGEAVHGDGQAKYTYSTITLRIASLLAR